LIYVDRESVPTPQVVAPAQVALMLARARAFYRQLPEERGQRRFRLVRPELLVHGLKGLLLLFHFKCSFCESKVESHSRAIDHLRPKAGSIGLDGERSPDHYWWLALDWRNLYLLCANCSRSRGNRFPVRGQRAPLEAGWSALRDENALLLDPCWDNPEEHLVFSADGSVAATHVDDLEEAERRRFGTPTRGQVTIDTFGLNRPSLIEQRAGEAARCIESLELWATALEPGPFLRLVGQMAPYLGMKRQVVIAWVREHGADRQWAEEVFAALFKRGERVAPPLRGGDVTFESHGTPTVRRGAPATDPASAPAGLGDELGEDVVRVGDVTLPVRGVEERERASAQQRVYDLKIQHASVEVDEEAASYRSRAAYIERIEIEGFTSLGDLRFDFIHPDSPSGGEAPWLMLLGENGVGKTSVLKAIALTLAGPRRLAELQQAPATGNLHALFREDGRVRVYLSSQAEPVELRRVGGRLEAGGEASGAKVFVRAFGPSRWFSLEGAPAPENDSFVRVENLFNPFVPLEPGESWLARLDGDRWNDVAAALKRLLQLPDDSVLPPINGEIRFHLGEAEPTPLRSLSSGYEAVVAMAADLTQLLLERWPSLYDAEGICLLDEIDAHLHPRWKMRIVDSLRRTFPRVQFVATTHEPLCLRGLRRGEILALRREAGAVVASRPTQDVSELRVDQLLTSRLFGLHSTLDPELEAQFDRYYALLSRHESALGEAERAELEELRGTVGSRGILGSTRRDQLIYRIIDEFVAREPAIADEGERGAEERWTAEQVKAAWASIPDLPEEPT
jgi:uncharacterized protein (TIGR02646 family)